MIRTSSQLSPRFARSSNLERSAMGRLFFGVAAIGLAIGAVACGHASGEESEVVGLAADTALPQRDGAVVVDGCVLDTWQRATLKSPETKRVLRTVILLCLIPREDGTVGPRDPSARTELARVGAELKQDGYRFHFGVAFTDETGQRYDGAQTTKLLASADFRRRFVQTLPEAAAPADGVEIDLQFLEDSARAGVTALMTETSAVIRPAKALNVFVPPSISIPSDLPGGEAFSRTELARVVDRMRIMTLDYSEKAPGPTIDPGWAVDAMRLALASSPNVDVAYPLYGTDFGPLGRRSITYYEARAIAEIANVPIERGPTGAPFVRYRAFGGESHQIWFDDAESTGRALGAWGFEVLPSNVGVLYYGLGAEDPSLWGRLAARLP